MKFTDFVFVGYECAPACISGQRTTWELVLSIYHVGLGIQLGSSDLETSTFQTELFSSGAFVPSRYGWFSLLWGLSWVRILQTYLQKCWKLHRKHRIAL